MTAKTRHGHGAHRAAHGADKGTPHERLNRMHAMPGRPEGAPMSAQAGGIADPNPAEGAGPMAMPPNPGMPSAPPGASPSTDDEEGDQS